jgi:hypothetical protein
MMTKEEAKVAVHAELRSLQLAKPMDAADLLSFCIRMHNSLQFRTKSDPLSDIRGWAENWQALWLRSN